MKITEFIDRLADNMGASREKAQDAYKGVMRTLREAMSRGEEVRLEGLGKMVPNLGTVSQFRPQKESETGQRVVDISFEQFRSSRRKLFENCPFQEELFDDESGEN